MDNIHGLGELDSSIAGLAADLESVLPDLVLGAAGIVEQEIRSRAPVNAGALVMALDTKSERRKSAASATVQIERSGKDGVEHYAIFQEFGTSKMPAQPFFRPGIAAATASVEGHLTNGVLEVVDQYAD